MHRLSRKGFRIENAGISGEFVVSRRDALPQRRNREESSPPCGRHESHIDWRNKSRVIRVCSSMREFLEICEIKVHTRAQNQVNLI